MHTTIPTVRAIVRLSADLLDALRCRASDQGRPLSHVMREALAAYVDRAELASVNPEGRPPRAAPDLSSSSHQSDSFHPPTV